MFRFLEKTRNRPDEEKYPALVVLSSIVMIIVIISWILLLRFFPQENSENNDKEVFSSIKGTFLNTFNGLEKGYKNIKSNTDDIFISN